VRIKGVDITKAGAREMDGIRKRIGLAFQGGALIGSMSVGENISLPILEHTTLEPSTIEVMVRIKLEQVGLSGFENYSPSQLSGGMKKRAAFARAMALDPEILFFDEPSAGLDPITAAGIDDLILSLKKAYALSIVVVTHELASAFLIADRIILLDRGNIATIGPVEEVRNSQHPRVRQFLDRIADSAQDDDVDHLRMFTEGIR
jgi:phospholipid/cholesterol/gamma-HCH transport system ATP-binding protein